MVDFQIKPIYNPRVSEKAPTFGETLGASFEQESGFVNIFNAMRQRSFPADPNFNLDEFFTRRPELIPYQSLMQDVESEAEAISVEAKIRQEEKNRATLAASGLLGFGTNMMAGFASPSTFIPFGAAVKGFKGAASVAALAAGSAAVDEAILQATQETRTAAETRANVVATALLGAALGSAVSVLSPRELAGAVENFGRQEPRGMAPHPSKALENEGLGLSAGIVKRHLEPIGDPGYLKDVLSPDELSEASYAARVLDKVMRLGAKASPVMRNLINEFPEVRGIQAALSDAGLQMRRQAAGEVFAAGGTVENRVNLRMRNLLTQGLAKIEDTYARYRTGKAEVNFLDRNRAEIMGATTIGGKLSWRQFSKALFVELQNPRPGQIKEIKEAAEFLRKEIYSPLFKELKEAEIIPKDMEETDVLGASYYLTHVFDKESVIKNPLGFDQMVTRAYQRAMEAAYAKRLEKVKTSEARVREDIEDLSKTHEQVKEEQAEIRLERELFEDTEVANLNRDRADLRRELRELDKASLELEPVGLVGPSARDFRAVRRKEIKDRIAAIDSLITPEGAAEIAKQNSLRRRSTLLSRALGRLERRQARVIELMEETDRQMIGQIKGIAKKAREFLNDLDSLSDADYAKGVAALEAEFRKVSERVSKLDAKVEKLREKALGLDPRLVEAEEVRAGAARHLDEVQELLESARREGPEFARRVLTEWFDDVAQEVADRIGRIAVRKNRLIELHGKLDPETTRARIAKLEDDVVRRDEQLTSWVAEREGVVNEDGSVDFTEGGKSYAAELRNRILGDPTRVVSMDLGGKRGSEYLRALDIPLEEKMEFLETDMDRLLRIYIRNVIPDLELERAGMGVNGSRAIEKVRKRYEKAKQDTAAREDLDQAAKEKEFVRLNNAAADTERLFVGQIQRLRHQRAVPDNPDAYLYRAGRLLQQWNVLTMMGNAVVPSILDASAAVMKFGMKRVWRHALKPFITQIKDLRMSQREALYAGMNDLLLQDRMYQLTDLMENTVGNRTKAEKAVEFLSNKMGIANLTTYWTQAMKQWVTPVAAGKILDALEAHMLGTSRWMTPAEARQVLAHAHIDADLARRIWRQQENGGIVKKNDLWLPNTESWDDPEAVDAFRTAVLGSVEGAILVPGLERPLFTDASLGHKLLFQFQSFMWSANTKLLMAGLQQRDWAVMEGIISSVGIGALSYAVDKMARGEWEEAQQQGYDVWADEIIARSPFLGVLSQGLKVGQEIPAVRDYLQFSNQGSERRFSDDPLGSIVGPSYTTAQRVKKLMLEFNHPTGSTANTVKQLTPYNQVVWARWMFQHIADQWD